MSKPWLIEIALTRVLGYRESMSQPIREVDPRGLRLPPGRSEGADLWKLPMDDREIPTELFDALQSLAGVAGEMRAGQLMAAVGELCADMHGRGLWEASDAEVLEAVWQFRRNFEGSMAGANRNGA